MASKKWNGSKWIRKERRFAIYMRDDFTCQYCGEDLRQATPQEVTLDHLQPRSKGGNNRNQNLITACELCNKQRSNHDWRGFATAGAVKRIERQIEKPLNMDLAKAIIRGEASNPRLEARR